MNGARRATTAALALLLAAALGALADEGRIPLHEPTTIVEPGAYIVTRDIAVTTGTVFLIAADDVTLDLGGHLLSSTGIVPVIEVADGQTDIQVLNGTLQGGSIGVQYTSSTDRIRLRAENLVLLDQDLGINVNRAESVDVIGCRVVSASSSAIRISGVTAPFSGRVIGNVVQDPGEHGIQLIGLEGGQVTHNLVSGHGASASFKAGIFLTSPGGVACGGNQVAFNLLIGGGNTSDGLVVDSSSDGNRIHDNVMGANSRRGMRVGSAGNHIVGNLAIDNTEDGLEISGARSLVRANTSAGNRGAGIDVQGSHHLIDANSCTGNAGSGLYFTTSGAHAYRDNFLRDNTSATGGSLGGNTDAGGNIF